MKQLNIAIIGSGVAGLTTAYLLNRKHNVTIFEKNDYIGGHTHTVMVNKDNDVNVPVDTGFIVMNHRTYPNLTKIFEQLDVELRDSDMSFGYNCEISGMQYSSKGIVSFFNKFKNIFRPSYYKIFTNMLKFYKISKIDLEKDNLKGLTLGDYLKKNGFSNDFINHHIIPMGCAVWSTPSDTMLDFPAQSFISFLNNHGLLSLNDAPKWRTVVGGSHAYVKKILATFNNKVLVNQAITSIKRNKNDVTITTEHGVKKKYDKVVIATHANDAYRLLSDPTSEEERLLKPWSYNHNHTILHTDISAMPANKRIWSSWNFIRENNDDNKSTLCLTYNMNLLQGLKTQHHYLVTLNTNKKLDKSKIILEMEYYHPQYTLESMETQHDLPTLNGINNTYYCGSYFNYGFHEDAATSGLEVAKHFGVEL